MFDNVEERAKWEQVDYLYDQLSDCESDYETMEIQEQIDRLMFAY